MHSHLTALNPGLDLNQNVVNCSLAQMHFLALMEICLCAIPRDAIRGGGGGTLISERDTQ